MKLKQYLQYLTEQKITKEDLKNLEVYADKLFRALGIDVEFTNHFSRRVNDPRNKKQITMEELTRLFRESYRKYGRRISELGPDAEAVINDMLTDINVPFVLQWDPKNKELDLVAKTVMRKKDFRTSNPILRID